MDSDFKFKQPQKTDVTPEQKPAEETADTGSVIPAEEISTDEVAVPPVEEQPAMVSGVITSNRPQKDHGLIVFIIMLILLVAAVGGVYAWARHDLNMVIKMNNNAANGTQKQIETLNSQLAATKENLATAAGSTSALPGDVTDVITESPIDITATSATVGAMFSHAATQVWIESGSSPDKLSEMNPKVTPIKAATDEVEMLKDLKPRTTYYYRAAGTVNGKTVYGGIVSFNTAK